MKCKICDSNAEELPRSRDGEEIDCPYCGRYFVVGGFNIDYYEDKSNFYKLSSWIREQNENWNKVPELDYEKFDQVLNIKDKKIKEKFDLLMLFLQNSLQNIEFNKDYEVIMENLGGSIDPSISKLCQDILVKCWCKDYNELKQIFQQALELKYITGKIVHETSFKFIDISFNGLQYLEQLEEPNKNSKNIFVAFNFDNDLTNIFNIYLKEAIEKEGFNYVVVNQDTVDHNKSINDEIIVKLKTSRIVIADFTNHRNSVYFEAGYAMGMNIPIIWTCQEGHENDISFDTRQFPHIVWKDEKDLVKQVIDRIKRIL